MTCAFRVPGQLDGHVTDAPGAAVDEDLVIRPDPGPVEQRFPSGEHDERKRRGLRHAERFRFVGNERRVGQHVLGQSAAITGQPPRTGVHFIPGLYPRHPLPDFFHDASDVTVEDGREFGREGERQAPQLAIQRIDAGCLHADHHVPGPQLGPGHVGPA